MADSIVFNVPAILLNELVPIPQSTIKITVVKSKATEAINVANQKDGRLAMIVGHKDQMQKVGVLAYIASYDGETTLRVRIDERLSIINVVPVDGYLTVDCKIRENTDLDSEELPKIMEDIHKESLNQKIGAHLKDVVPSIAIDAYGSLLLTRYDDRYPFLEEQSLLNRAKIILNKYQERSMQVKVDRDIDRKVNESLEKNQKEYYLREKMRIIQEELGESAKKESDCDELKKKIDASLMSEATKKKAILELNRFKAIPSNSPDSALTKTYLDFLVGLPWGIYTEDSNDLANAQRILDRDHYGLTKVKDRILEYLAVRIYNNTNPQNILCLVGPPGVGKTSLSKSIAEALNKKFVKLSLGGVHDESEIRGHRRTYVGALPGRILQSINKAGCANPLFLLDEIDKMSSDFKGDPTSAMLEVLDGNQNSQFSDHYLEEPFDLSKVFFLATANYLEKIPEALRDRLEVINIASYTEVEKFHIARNHLIPKQLKLHGVTSDLVEFDDAAIKKIITSYTREAGVRECERVIGSIIRKVIKQNLIDKVDHSIITESNLVDYLGKEKYFVDETYKVDQVARVNGLAYTAVGGTSLPIEATKFLGDGKLILTGQLGDVMKESANIAYSYVKANYEKYHINPEDFKKYDIHIHALEGAVPKDGPSAGVTLTTVLVSLLANKKVKWNVGMTGEVGLTGQVYPIGGLKEKSMGAIRADLDTVFIPAGNKRDLDEIDSEITSHLKYVPVEHVDEILEKVIIW